MNQPHHPMSPITDHPRSQRQTFPLCHLWRFAAILFAAFYLSPSARAQTLGEALNATNLVWTTGGNAAWFSQTTETHDGVAAARSGLITHNQASWVETTVSGPGILSFWWKVSSEASYDYLHFFINAAEQSQISGTVNWQSQTYNLSAGNYTLRWSYTKDGSANSGSDAGWLDEISLAPVTLPAITSQPVGGTVNPGDDFTFSATATGNPPPAYQWRFNGTPLSGKTNGTLTLTNLQPSQSGPYDVVLTNISGSVTSTPASLIVYVPPPLSSPLLEVHPAQSGLELTVSPDSQAGVLYLFEAQSLETLLSTPALMLVTNMPVANNLRLPLAPTNTSRFFNALRMRGSQEDFAAPDFPVGEEQPFVLWTLGFPATLVSGAIYTADFLLVVSTNELAAYTGPAQLSVVRLEDETPHPNAIITPGTIFFSQGKYRTNVLV